ncbi:MAG TPA: hypothetical protein VFT27_12240 [Actinomycetota bacterium]|nr:hypothetical protein [Actinomycetota bacterium]
MRLRILALTAILVGPSVLADGALAADGDRPQPVLDGRGFESDYSVVEGYRSWVRGDRLIVEPDGGDKYVVQNGDVGAGSDLALETALGNVLVFTGSGDEGDVRVWDLDARQFVATPEGVNTSVPEWQVAISGDHLLFGRDPHYSGHTTQVVLMDIPSGTFEVLARSRHGAGPDSVNGDWATYTVCAESTCDVFRFRISTGHARRLPHGPRRSLYDSTVTTDGTVFASRSRPGICRGVSIVRWTPGDPTVLWSFRDGLDAFGKDALVTEASTTLFFTRVTCTRIPDDGTRLDYDVYRLNA